MDYFIAHTSALKLIRSIRCGLDLRLVPTDVREPTPIEGKRITLHRLGISELCNMLGIAPSTPLHLLVPTHKDRRRCAGLECIVRKKPRAQSPFLEVVPLDLGVGSDLLPQGIRIFVERPACLTLGMAAQLAEMVNANRISHLRAALKLLKLCLELCGTFSSDPNDPHMGDAVCNIPPVMKIEDLQDVVKSCEGARGVRLLREVIPQVFERSGSPAESHLGEALFGQSDYGGFELAEFESNVSLELNPAQRQVLTCGEITPDFKMEQYKIAIERQGGVHEQGDNPLRDRRRMLDYQTLGWRVFNLFNDDVKNPSVFNRTARRIVTAIATYEGPAIQHLYEQRLADQSFLAKQQVLFEVFCPWLSYSRTFD